MNLLFGKWTRLKGKQREKNIKHHKTKTENWHTRFVSSPSANLHAGAWTRSTIGTRYRNKTTTKHNMDLVMACLTWVCLKIWHSPIPINDNHFSILVDWKGLILGINPPSSLGGLGGLSTLQGDYRVAQNQNSGLLFMFIPPFPQKNHEDHKFSSIPTDRWWKWIDTDRYGCVWKYCTPKSTG